MKISFYDGHGKLEFNPFTERNIGVGGTETVIIQTAKALSARGHDVTVYTRTNFPDIYDGVKYYQHVDYEPSEEDVLVGFENFPEHSNAKKVFNWSNRYYTNDVVRYPNVDKLLVVSKWQRDYFASNLSPELVGKIAVVEPGVDKEFFREDIERKDFDITYAGFPGKGGMQALIPIMQRLKIKVPEVIPYVAFHVYGKGNLWGWDDDQYRPLYDQLIRERMLYHGQIGKKEMTMRLNQTKIFIYPVGAHQKETFCLGVLEAMAAGCVVIASDSGNIKNLVGDRGFIIPGDINHYSWGIEAVEKIIKIFNDPVLFGELSNKSREFARSFTWEKTAETFEKLL